MPEVNIYIETDSVFQGKTDRKCGYVLSVMTRHGEKTKEGFGHLEGTYHQTVLITLAEALERMAVPCHICVHTKDVYVASRILKLEEMAGSDWMDSKGKQIKNTEEWRRIECSWLIMTNRGTYPEDLRDAPPAETESTVL